MTINKPVIVIVGPTASGKTEVSIKLAQLFNGEIISADSRQIYQGMDIGTAKPTNMEMLLVPHHLINIADPTHPWSLAAFQGAALDKIDKIRSRCHLPFIVGGTGQYIWGLIEGWQTPEKSVNLMLRQTLENWMKDLGSNGLYHVLARLDPEATDFIQPENVRRTIRALEVIYSSGRKFSDQRLKISPDEDFIILGIQWDRKVLYERVDTRIEIMLNTGLVEEVRNLINTGLDAESSALSAIGYREIVDYLHGKQSLDEAVMLIKRHTRQFIRRQANWFKPTDPRINWFTAGADLPERMSYYIKGML